MLNSWELVQSGSNDVIDISIDISDAYRSSLSSLYSTQFYKLHTF